MLLAQLADTTMLLQNDSMIAASRQMKQICELACRAGRSEAKTLITGESGVGKDLVAREIHRWSGRATRRFVPVNCAALTETLLETELFGHLKGSFTGAYRDHPGKLQQADGGTLFLDEVGDMSLRMQALLLRFLENGEVQRVGDTRVAARVDVRVVAATNRNLAERVASGHFREDLLYRLRVIQIHVPPLRDRLEDIRALTAHFVLRSSRNLTFSEDALAILSKYRWPGNVRELQNVVEQAAWLAKGPVIEVADLPDTVRNAVAGPLVVRQERRRQVADQLFELLSSRQYTFWEHVYPMFVNHDITRHDMRELVRCGLATTRGNYRSLLHVFGMDPVDYHRFHNFLAAHDCKLDYRAFRSGTAPVPVSKPALPTAS